MKVKYTAFPESKLGAGAPAPVAGAWMPILISVALTPVRSALAAGAVCVVPPEAPPAAGPELAAPPPAAAVPPPAVPVPVLPVPPGDPAVAPDVSLDDGAPAAPVSVDPPAVDPVPLLPKPALPALNPPFAPAARCTSLFCPQAAVTTSPAATSMAIDRCPLIPTPFTTVARLTPAPPRGARGGARHFPLAAGPAHPPDP